MNPVKALIHRVGFALRETGQALERTGCRMQGIYSYEEKLSRHMPIMPLGYKVPSIGSNAWVAPSGVLTGDVSLGDNSSVWYGAVVRGDFKPVSIGSNTNIQDSAYVGATSENSPEVKIGDNVSVGHGAVLKGCTVRDNVLIGINAVVSENVEISKGAVIAAGSYLEEGTVVPSGEVWAGSPAKKLRDVKPGEAEYLKTLPNRYIELAADHEDIVKLLKLKQEEYSH